MKNIGKKSLAAATLLIALNACASEPALDVSRYRHGNLAAAQESIRDAYDRLTDAQDANHDELGGHAARAKELLREAADEVKFAAEAANRR
jgi:hypothetical protein